MAALAQGGIVPHTASPNNAKFRTRGEWPEGGLRPQHLNPWVKGGFGPSLSPRCGPSGMMLHMLRWRQRAHFAECCEMHGRQLSSRHAGLIRILRNDHSRSEERKKRVVRRYKKALVDHNQMIERQTMELKDKTFIVTGASSGIGAVAALLLAAKGANVVLGARRQAELDQFAGQIMQSNGKAVCLSGDVSDEMYAQALVNCAKGRIWWT